MIVISENAGLFGPFQTVELLEDRALCDGAGIPYSVVGPCTVLDAELPDGGRAEDYDLIDGELVKREPVPPDIPPDPDPEAPAEEPQPE